VPGSSADRIADIINALTRANFPRTRSPDVTGKTVQNVLAHKEGLVSANDRACNSLGFHKFKHSSVNIGLDTGMKVKTLPFALYYMAASIFVQMSRSVATICCA
jgi:hypothetical protein